MGKTAIVPIFATWAWPEEESAGGTHPIACVIRVFQLYMTSQTHNRRSL